MGWVQAMEHLMFVTHCQRAKGQRDRSAFGRLQKQREGLHMPINDKKLCLKINRSQGKAAHKSLTSQYGTHACTLKLRDRCSTA